MELQEHLLRHFLGQRTVMQEVVRDAKDHRLVLAHDAGKIPDLGRRFRHLRGRPHCLS